LKKVLLGLLIVLVVGVAKGWFTTGENFRYADQAFGRESVAADHALISKRMLGLPKD